MSNDPSKESMQIKDMLIAIAVTAVVLFLDVSLIVTAVHQIAAVFYPQTNGQITKSEVEATAPTGGNRFYTYSAVVAYRYAVDGEVFENDVYRYEVLDEKGYASGGGESGREYTMHIVESTPVGAEVPVYYDPNDPSDAVLATGLEGRLLLLAMLLAPFNLLTLRMWAGLRGFGPYREPDHHAARVPLEIDGRLTRIRIDLVSPGLVAGITLGVWCIAAMVVIVVIFGFRPPLVFTIMMWLVVVGLSVLAFARRRHLNQSGRRDLTIDDMVDRVSLPCLFGREQEVSVSFDDVSAVIVRRGKSSLGQLISEHSRTRAKRTGKEKGGRRFVALVLASAGSEDGEVVADFNDKADARTFAEWLREHLAVETLVGDGKERFNQPSKGAAGRRMFNVLLLTAMIGLGVYLKSTAEPLGAVRRDSNTPEKNPIMLPAMHDENGIPSGDPAAPSELKRMDLTGTWHIQPAGHDIRHEVEIKQIDDTLLEITSRRRINMLGVYHIRGGRLVKERRANDAYWNMTWTWSDGHFEMTGQRYRGSIMLRPDPE